MSQMVLRDRWLARMLGVIALLSIVTTLGIVVMLAVQSAGFFTVVSPWRLFTDASWRPSLEPATFGVWSLFGGTFVIAVLALCCALPVGIMAAIFLSEFASAGLRNTLKPTLEVLAAVPSLVFGFLALRYLTPLLRVFDPSLPAFSALSAGIAMGIMLLPTFATLAEDAIFSVPQSLREAAYALGAQRLPTLFSIVLPNARSGIGAAALITMSRAIGETLIVALAAGLSPRLSADPTQPMETVTAFMLQSAMGDVPFGSFEYRTVFVLGLLLFLMTGALNVLASRWRGRR